jgi:hypothetical protein
MVMLINQLNCCMCDTFTTELDLLDGMNYGMGWQEVHLINSDGGFSDTSLREDDFKLRVSHRVQWSM